MLISQAGPPLFYYNAISHRENSLLALLLPCIGELRLRRALAQGSRAGPWGLLGVKPLEGAGRSSPQEEGNKAPHLFVVPLPKCDMQTGTLGKGGLARKLAVAAFLCCRRKHVYSCICVCMALDGERR